MHTQGRPENASRPPLREFHRLQRHLLALLLMGKQAEGLAQKALDSPCAGLYQASLRCLEVNNYNRDKCQDAFTAYKECKKQEVATRLERRQEAKRNKQDWF